MGLFMISAMNSGNVIGYQMGREREAIKRLNFDGILNVNPQTVFDVSLILLKVRDSKKLQSFLKMWFYFPSTAKAYQNFTLALEKNSGGARPNNTLCSTEQFSPLSELAVVFSIVDEGVIVPFRQGFHDICCLALQRLLLKSWFPWRLCEVSVKWVTTCQIT